MKILSEQGFKDFEGFIPKGEVTSLLRFSFSNDSSIDCTKDHKFLLKDGMFREAENLSEGDMLYPNVVIKRKELIDFPEGITVYDALNVKDTHSYQTNSVISHNCVYLDEFAFVNNDSEFYTSTYPVISSSKNSKIIITSSANGVGNLFYNLWQGAITNNNEYTPIRVDWWDVPGRDDEWKEQTIRNTSQLQFDQEYGNSFLGSGNTLLSSSYLMSLQHEDPIIIRDDGKFLIYEEPEQDEQKEFTPQYYIFVDVSKGRGQDYSIINVIKQYDISSFKQVAKYRDNLISPLILPTVIYKIANWYNNAFVIIESNDNGNIVATGLYYDLEYENMYVGSAVKGNSLGLEMNKKIKRIGCSNLKDMCETGKIEIVDLETIRELSAFEIKGSSYEASRGHDDIVMTLVAFGWFIGTEMFSSLNGDKKINDIIQEEKDLMEQENLIPFGIIDNFDDEEHPVYENGYEVLK